MKKVVERKISEVIEVDTLIRQLQTGSTDYIVFYRTGNEKNGIPVFLVMTGSKSYFESPVVSRGRSYEYSSVSDCVTAAAKSRQLYVLEKNEGSEIFKDF